MDKSGTAGNFLSATCALILHIVKNSRGKQPQTPERSSSQHGLITPLPPGPLGRSIFRVQRAWAATGVTGESVHDVPDTLGFRSGLQIGSRRFPSPLQPLHHKLSFSVLLPTAQAVHRLQQLLQAPTAPTQTCLRPPSHPYECTHRSSTIPVRSDPCHV